MTNSKDDSATRKKNGTEKFVPDPGNWDEPTEEPALSPKAELQNAVRSLLDNTMHPAEELTTDQLGKLAHLVRLLDTQVLLGADGILEKLWEAIDWQPLVGERRRALITMVEEALRESPNHREYAGRILAGNLRLFWPTLELSESDEEEIVRVVSGPLGKGEGPKISGILCGAIPAIGKAAQYGPKKADLFQAFKDAKRNR